MKLYNPFKWHVIQTPTDTYTVRRRSMFLLWWNYADISSYTYVWQMAMHVAKYCYTSDKQRAIDLAQRLRGGGKVIWP